jgi:hypothetical protein
MCKWYAIAGHAHCMNILALRMKVSKNMVTYRDLMNPIFARSCITSGPLERACMIQHKEGRKVCIKRR